MDRRLLELQSNRLEEVLKDYGIAVRILGGEILPQVVCYRVQLGRGRRVRELEGLNREIALSLQVPKIIVNSQPDGVIIEVPRSDGVSVPFNQVITRFKSAPPGQSALLGLSNRGVPLLLCMSSPTAAHALVSGMTGSGKTELLCTMLVSLVLWSKVQDARFLLVDPKGRKLAGLSSLRGVEDCCKDAQSATGLLTHLLQTLERRDRQGFNRPALYLFVDEVADLVMVGGHPVEVGLARLVQRGREAGIHCIIATQRPSADVVAGLMRANFPVRISGAVNSAAEASIALGVPGSNAERLLGLGDMLVVHQGQKTRFKAALVHESDLACLLPVRQTGRRQAGLRVECHAVKEPGSGSGDEKELREVLAMPGPGRPGAIAESEMLAFIKAQLQTSGECSQRLVRRWHIEQYGTDVNPPRVAAAIATVKKQLVDESLDLS